MYPQLIPLIVTANYIGEEGTKRPGDRIRVVEARARFLIELGNAKLDKGPGPAEARVAGPTETKAPDVKKSFGAPTTGPLIATPSSVAPGPAAPLSSSQAAPASTPSRPRPAGAPARRPRRVTARDFMQ